MTVDPAEHIGLVHQVARRYKCLCTVTCEYGDLISAGTIGLMRAAELFDPARGNKFSTYARFWIRSEIGREVQNTRHSVRVPCYIQEAARKRGEPYPARRAFSLDDDGDGEDMDPMARAHGHAAVGSREWESVELDAEELALAESTRRQLQGATRVLDEKHGEVIRLMLRGHNLASCGRLLGLTTEGVRQRYLTALKVLRLELSDA